MVNKALRMLMMETDELGPVAAALDGENHSGRMNLLYGLDRRALGRLYQLAATAPDLTLDFFVSNVEPLVPVAHDGWNSIPVPHPWRKFKKVMCRPAGDTTYLVGYNEYRSKGWLGPGYFHLMPTVASEFPTDRGAYVVDYFRVPDGAVPASWPPVRLNTSGLSRFVYGGTRDYLRRVSEHVCVGRPYRGSGPDEALDFSFVLCRQPP